MALEGSDLFKRKNLYSDEGRLLSENGFEDAGRKKVFIGKHGFKSGAGSITLYTVPANKVLYIIYAHLTFSSLNAGATSCKLIINPEGTNMYLIYQFIASDAEPRIVSTPAQLAMPIRLEATRTVIITTGVATNVASAAFVGWLEDA